MKKLILMLALIITSLSIKAQMVEDVPAEIVNVFIIKFPGVNPQEVDWETEGTNYKAEFSRGERDYEVLFDNKGGWISTEIEDVAFSEIPSSIQTKLNTSEYADWRVTEIDAKKNPDQTVYKIEVRSGLKSRDLYFDEDGKMVREDS